MTYNQLKDKVLHDWPNAKILNWQMFFNCCAFESINNGNVIKLFKSYEQTGVYYVIKNGSWMSVGLRYGLNGPDYYSPPADQKWSSAFFDLESPYKSLSEDEKTRELKVLNDVQRCLSNYRHYIDMNYTDVNIETIMDNIYNKEKEIDIRKYWLS